jgi:RNA polymerase sigma factor (sigma-70 family)
MWMRDEDQRRLFHLHCRLRARLEEERDADRAALPLLAAGQRPVYWRRREELRRELVAETIGARNLLIEKNIHLARWAVRQAVRKAACSVDIKELESEAHYALVRSVMCFNADYGTQFSTYAGRAIFKQLRTRVFRETGYHMRNCAYEAERDKEDAAVDISRDADESILQSDLHEALETGVSGLDSKEREVVRLRFPLDCRAVALTLEEVGNRLGVTKERVRQIQNKALIKLRSAVGGLRWRDEAEEEEDVG